MTSHIPAFLRQHAHLLHGKGRKEDAPTVDNAGADGDDGNDSDFDRDNGVQKIDGLLFACLGRLFQGVVFAARITACMPAALEDHPLAFTQNVWLGYEASLSRAGGASTSNRRESSACGSGPRAAEAG